MTEVSSNAFTAYENPKFLRPIRSFPSSRIVGETESHETFESDAVLALIGILVRWIGVGIESNDVFKSFFNWFVY